ncbi:glycosyltransferase family 2 protein [candidate division KSB1 bacterium]|nr:glycosyltransferase family 2 protein [candidate division KSB1 bacterium]RQW10708.1 MAG: glycosyltransferase family 2 protein [candidate division KSB1 bacterium]
MRRSEKSDDPLCSENVLPTPFFSVVIPTCDRAELLGEAVESVLAQTCGDFELIVVDDSPNDATKQVIESFADNRIQYRLNCRTKGAAGARNTGIFMARGKWIAFLDDDDVWLPEKLDCLFARIHALPDDVGLVYSGCAFYDFDKGCVRWTFSPSQRGWLFDALLYKNCIGGFSNVVMRADLLRRIDGLDETFVAYQDGELYVRVAQVAKIDFVDDVLVYIRSSNADRISTNRSGKSAAVLSFAAKYENYIKEDKKLKHRWTSRLFAYALLQGQIGRVFQWLPWTLAGLILDRKNIKWLIRIIAAEIKYSVQKALKKESRQNVRIEI